MVTNSTNKENTQSKAQESKALDDEQRVKVLSPGLLVAKRFFRNKLAIVGLVILVTMFLFAFIGGAVTPYSESQVFRTTEKVLKDFAGVTKNKDFQISVMQGKDFPSSALAQIIKAVNKGETEFEVKDVTYSLIEEGTDFYQIAQMQEVATVLSLRGNNTFNAIGDNEISETVKEAYAGAIENDLNTFEADNKTYYIAQKGRQVVLNVMDQIAIASKKIVYPYAAGETIPFNIQLAAQQALVRMDSNFEVNEEHYQLEIESTNGAAKIRKGDVDYGYISEYSIRPTANDSFLPVDFLVAVEAAVVNGESTLHYEVVEGEVIDYTIERKNDQYMVRSEQETQLNDLFAAPSKEHWLGTDGNGMDILTRLMFGGRISLMIGFVVVLIQLVIGVLLGGLAGYFGGWADNLIMRIVDTVICIPSLPLYIILGSVMDFYQIDPRVRIYMLCVILGLLTWPRIARMVRGQILSLREQEFMIATEATGIRISKRIFKHLVPNVIPQLIVIATMGLGDVIITEATLSFLGLGVKFPYASWGNIVNAVNDVFVLTNYWFVWIPAGFLILITVLGFNFVGDGLRDAFDPKMKR